MVRRFAVIGLGEFGQQLVENLVARGHEVLAIDQDGDALEQVRDRATRAVVADTSRREELEAAGVASADVAVVSLGKAMDGSILTTMHLKDLGVREIVVKGISAEHGRILTAVGANEVIYPERDTGERLAQELAAVDLVHEIPLFDEHALIEMLVPEALVGRTLAECDLRAAHHLSVVRIRRYTAGHEKWVAASADERLQLGDQLMVLAKVADAEAFRRRYPRG